MPKRTNTSSSQDFSARLRFEMKKSGLSNVEILKLLSDELRKTGYWTKTADIKPQQLIKWLNGSNPSNDVKKGFEINTGFGSVSPGFLNSEAIISVKLLEGVRKQAIFFFMIDL